MMSYNEVVSSFLPVELFGVGLHAELVHLSFYFHDVLRSVHQQRLVHRNIEWEVHKVVEKRERQRGSFANVEKLMTGQLGV